MTRDAALLHDDQIIDKYRVVRKLGAGGMGAIYIVEHLELKDVFRAMKVLIPSANEAGANDTRFEREAKVAMKITSRHAVKVVDYGHLPFGPPYWGGPYLVMELLDGDDLAKVLQQRDHLPVEEAARYIHEACDALAELHDEDVVHRDIKPANLFLVRGSKGRRYLKVLDFGIAKVMPNAGNLTVKHMTGEASIGTLAYMSPEQILTPRKVDQRTDIWALGVVLYELVTGSLPFQPATPQAMPLEITGAQPPPPSSVRAGIPLAFDAIVMKCLQKDPSARFESAHELMTALHAFVAPPTRDSRPQEEVDHEAVTRLRDFRSVPAMPAVVSPSGESGRLSVDAGLAPTMPLPLGPFGAPMPAAVPVIPPQKRTRMSPVVWGLVGALLAALLGVVIVGAFSYRDRDRTPVEPTGTIAQPNPASSVAAVMTATQEPHPTVLPETPTPTSITPIHTAAPKASAVSTRPKASSQPFDPTDPGGHGSHR